MEDEKHDIVIRFDDACKELSGRMVLDYMNFEVRKGESFVIIGPSGMGKSVTLKHMVGLLKADSGRVLVHEKVKSVVREHDVGLLAPRELERLRDRFGYLFQDGALLASLTVGENVALPLYERDFPELRRKYGRSGAEAYIWEKVKNKLELVEMSHAIDNMPSELSGGMRKRAGLARAVIREPDIVLYDEPSSGLDPVMTTHIGILIRDLQQKLGVTSVTVSHDIESAFYIGDRVAMIYNGKMRQIGTPDEIQASEDPVVRQFIRGESEGPLTEGRQALAGR